MAHFAELDDNNMVLRVIVVDDQYEADGENWCHNFAGGRWKQCSYNTRAGKHLAGGIPFRKNYPYTGWFYNEEIDGFVPPQNYPSWFLNKEEGLWNAPVSRPDNKNYYKWNEETLSWDLAE